MVFTEARFIVPQSLAGLRPVEVLHKQWQPIPIDLPENLQNLHIVYRHTFPAPANGQARIRITADDSYRLFCNGRLVGMGPTQGYAFAYRWNAYDLAPFLRDGENELTAEVYYHGLICRAYASGDRRIGLIAEVTDGAGRVIDRTDGTWQCGRLHAYVGRRTLGYDTAFADDYDGRLEAVDFSPAVPIDTDHVLCETLTEPLWFSERGPVLTEPLPDGGLFFDFGEEITGHLTVTACGRAGQRVRILHGEETEETPLRVRYRMRCNCLCDERWTLHDGQNTHRQFDYKAFRYAAMLPEPGVTVERVSVLVRHHRFDDGLCTLETPDDRLRQVWQICKNAVKYGAQETLVDCPMREKGQYLGDLTVIGAVHPLLTRDTSLLRQALEDTIRSGRICRGLMAVAPGSFMQEIADYSLQFPLLALRYHQFTGDLSFLRTCLASCEGMLDHFAAFARPDGLLFGVNDKWNLVDWPQGLRDGYDVPLTEPMAADSPAHAVLNAFYIGAWQCTEQIRTILGIDAPRRSPALIRAFDTVFWDPAAGLYRDSEHTAHRALHSSVPPAFFGFCPPQGRQSIGDFIMEKGLCCGVYMSYFVLKALCRLGRPADAYRLIVNDGEHSWLNMVREGATTCFEAWGKDQKANTSLCHPWAAAPIALLAEDILPALPALGRIVCRE